MKQNKKILKEFFRYTSANVMGMIGLSCYILADTWFIANGIGPDGLTALNLAISIYSFISGIGLMLGIGAATRYTIWKAQGREKEAAVVFTNALVWGLGAGLVIALAGVAGSGHISRLLGADQVTYQMTNVYLKTVMCFAPAYILNNIFLAFVRNDNGPHTAMAGMVLGSLSNIVLDWVFIYPLGMGMFGAAFATGIAPLVSLGIQSFHWIRKKSHIHLARGRVKLHLLKDFCVLGLSSLVGEVASGVVLIVFNLLILGIAGNLGVAAYGIIANISIVVLSIFNGIASGMQPLVSRYYGKAEKLSLNQVYRLGMVSAALLAVLCYVVLTVFRVPVVAAFNSQGNEQLASYAANGMVIYFAGFIFAGLNVVTAVFYSATERAGAGFALSIARAAVLLIPIAFVMARVWGMRGIWLSFPITEALTLLLAFLPELILRWQEHTGVVK